MEKKTNYKVIVAHHAQQHSFQTAIAFGKIGILNKYITTVYDRKGTILSFLKFLLKNEDRARANNRKELQIEDHKIIQFDELIALLALLLSRMKGLKFVKNKINQFLIDSFGNKVAEYVIDNKIDMLVMYDTLATKAFSIIKEKSPSTILVLDMSAPYMGYMDQVFTIEAQQKKNSCLFTENNSKFYIHTLTKAKREIQYADFFLVASEFAKKSLTSFGVDPARIFLCPYGLKNENVKSQIINNKTDKKLRCIFVGTVNYKKGIQYFLEAARILGTEKYEFKAYGSILIDLDIKDKNICEFKGHVIHNDIIKNMGEADILVFPTLADGYGFVVTEALSVGTPVICSENAGACDIITNGYNGFRVPAGNAQAIIDRITWFRDNPECLILMRENAKLSVAAINWERYYKGICDFFDILTIDERNPNG